MAEKIEVNGIEVNVADVEKALAKKESTNSREEATRLLSRFSVGDDEVIDWGWAILAQPFGFYFIGHWYQKGKWVCCHNGLNLRRHTTGKGTGALAKDAETYLEDNITLDPYPTGLVFLAETVLHIIPLSGDIWTDNCKLLSK